MDAENQFRGIDITASSFDGDEGLEKVLDEILQEISKNLKGDSNHDSKKYQLLNLKRKRTY